MSSRKKSPRADRILFVNDDPEARKIFADCMRRQGFIIDVAHDGHEALKWATHYPYAVVATDQAMPGLDGIDLARRLRSVQPDSTYVLLTGSQANPRQLQANVFENIVRKPWDSKQLAKILREGIQLYAERNERRSGQWQRQTTRQGVLVIEAEQALAIQLGTWARLGTDESQRTTLVSSVDEAIAKLSREAHAVVVLGSCGEMPLRALEKLRACDARVPVVMLSSSKGPESRAAYRQAGAEDCLFEEELGPQILGQAIRHALENVRHEARIDYLSNHDQLTGLANRKALRRRLQRVASADKPASHAALLLLDFNQFKKINAHLGHAAGDTVLQRIAERLRGSVREHDLVARLNGNEFAMTIEDLSDTTEATRVAQRVLNSFATPIPVDGQFVRLSPSIGIAVHPDHAATAEELISEADSAMSRAKEVGDNNYEFFNQEAYSSALQRLNRETELSHALERGEFRLHYQPQLSLGTGNIVGLEVLLRWQHPTKGLLPPAEFIPILEDTGLIIRVGEWILHAVCQQIAEWSRQGLKPPRIAVNVSPRQFEDDSLGNQVRRALADCGLKGHLLELEITESVILKDIDATRKTLAELSELGVRVAIDDFGIGYSSLRYLKSFPINTLKIDRSFIKDVTHDASGAAITSAIIGLGKAMNLDVIAEGVETEGQVEFLREQGCGYVQGFYFSPPRPVDAATAWVQENAAAPLAGPSCTK